MNSVIEFFNNHSGFICGIVFIALLIFYADIIKKLQKKENFIPKLNGVPVAQCNQYTKERIKDMNGPFYSPFYNETDEYSFN